MTSGALGSDHVNYLILRYLQEAGHERAASAFYNEWHRQPEYRNPENYSFAPVVRRSELIHVIQDGLHLDELVSKRKGIERQYQFTGANARERDGAVLENGTIGSRPGSSAKRKGRVPAMRPPDEFPTPAPKRQRISEGSDGIHLNGDRDAMDVDAASVSADAEDDAEVASPAGPSEPEPDMVEVPERYDSMDVAVQTESKPRTKTSTMYWKVDKPGASILHSEWNPNTDSDNATKLLAVGESLARIYNVPEATDAGNVTRTLGVHEPLLPQTFAVTAAAWHPSGRIATFAVDSLQHPADVPRQTIVIYDLEDLGTSTSLSLPPSLEPTGIVLAVRYSWDGNHLLVARTNLQRGSLFVFDVSNTATENIEPIASQSFEHQVLDVAWTWRDGFFVCGDGGLLKAYVVATSRAREEYHLTEEGHPSKQGLIEVFKDVKDSERRWDKIRFDRRSTSLCLLNSEGKKIACGYCSPQGPPTVHLYEYIDLPGPPTAIAFQPATSPPNPMGGPERLLLAATCDDGYCAIYSTNRMDNTGHEMVLVATAHLEESPALALAWSPDGAYLAVGGPDMVQIWKATALSGSEDADAAGKTKFVVRHHDPFVTWRPDPAASGPRNGEHAEDHPLSEPSLNWSTDGESLAFVVDRQVSTCLHYCAL